MESIVTWIHQYKVDLPEVDCITCCPELAEVLINVLKVAPLSVDLYVMHIGVKLYDVWMKHKTFKYGTKYIMCPFDRSHAVVCRFNEVHVNEKWGFDTRISSLVCRTLDTCELMNKFGAIVHETFTVAPSTRMRDQGEFNSCYFGSEIQ